MLTLDSHTSDPFVVLEVTGELDLDTQDSFEAAVNGHLDSSSLIVDLSRLDFMAISSLRSLMTCQQSADEGDRSLVYADTPAQALRLLALSGVDEYLDLRQSELHAEPV